jgi:hypothetical protein
MKKVQMERNNGIRPGAELQPPGLGILKDQKMMTRLTNIKKMELTKSIQALG